MICRAVFLSFDNEIHVVEMEGINVFRHDERNNCIVFSHGTTTENVRPVETIYGVKKLIYSDWGNDDLTT